MLDAVKNYVNLASGFTEVTRQRAMAAAKALVASGEATAEQVTNLADELLVSSRNNRDAMLALVRFEVDRALNRLGLATADEVASLQRRVTSLEGTLAKTSQTTPAKKAAQRTGQAAVRHAQTVESSADATSSAPVKKAATKAPAKTATKTAAARTSATKTAAKATAAKAAKAGPAKASPAKASPAKASPAKASPAKATASDASPAKATAAKATAAKASPAKATARNAGSSGGSAS